MEKEFDFEKIGKQMPYTVPSGFFEDMQKNITKQIQQEKRKKYRIKMIAAASGIAAVVAIMLFISNLYNIKVLKEPRQANITCSVKTEKDIQIDNEQTIPEELDQLIEELSDEELEELAVLSESDLFLY